MTTKNVRTVFIRSGFTLIETLIAMVILAAIGVSLATAYSSSWKNVLLSKKTLIAGHLIEQKTEQMRMLIDRNPSKYFPPSDSQFTSQGIYLTWKISAAARPTDGANLSNTRKCSFVASWGKSKNDTLKVTTYLSKLF